MKNAFTKMVEKVIQQSLIAFIFSLSYFCSKAQVNLTYGLIAYYPFNGNSYDSSGNGNNPIFNNATLTIDRFGNANSAYYFNGNGSYMQIPASASLDSVSAFSFSFWLNVQAFYTGHCGGNYVMCRSLEGINAYNFAFSDAAYGNANGINFCNTPIDTSHEGFYGFGVGGLYPMVHSGSWYHIVATNDGKKSSLYVNDSLVAVNPSVTISSFKNNPIFIGRYFDLTKATYWLNGTLDDIRIYNRALDTAEITTLYKDSTKSTNPLPITLQSFQAEAKGLGNTRIKFSTTNSNDAQFIVIEKSYDGIDFSTITTIEAKGNDYSFIDNVSTIANTAYYRLIFINKDGSSSNSKTFTVSLVGNRPKGIEATIFPNPTHNNKINVDLYLLNDNIVTIKIIDINNKEVFQHEGHYVKGHNIISFNDLKAAKGIYSVNIVTNGSVLNKKLLVY